jgi:hypothetical protein
MNEKEMTFELYKQYLVQIATKEGRPFRLPKNVSALDKRTDASFFYALQKKLEQNGVSDKRKIQLFMETACKKLSVFHISDILDGFEEVFNTFKNTKEDGLKEKKEKILKAFVYLKEYSIINNINTYEDLTKGSPPILLKLWKQGKLDDRVIVTLIDFNMMKKKPWYRIYCGALIPKIKNISDEIRNNVHLVSLIESELLKFKQALNK